MAGAKSNYLAAVQAQRYLGGVAGALATHLYLALCTVVPTAASTGATITETDYAGYARTEIGTGNNQTDAWNAAVGQTVTNKGAITAPSATGPSTNPLLAIAIVDSPTPGAGNIYAWASIVSTAIATGDTPQVKAGAISYTEA